MRPVASRLARALVRLTAFAALLTAGCAVNPIPTPAGDVSRNPPVGVLGDDEQLPTAADSWGEDAAAKAEDAASDASDDDAAALCVPSGPCGGEDVGR